MKIAIATNKNDENSEVSEVSGRATYYLIYENKKLIKTIKNPFAIGGGGAGYGVAKMVSDEKVDIIVAGRFGNNMISTLDDKKILHKELTNIKVKEAMEKIENES